MPNLHIFFAAIIAISFSLASAQINIRVNEVGYEKNGAKRAVVQSDVAAISETSGDIVNAQGTSVFPVTLKAGETVSGWSGRYFKVADFSEFNQDGEFRLKVGDKFSQPFKIGENILLKETGSFQVDFFNKMRNTDNGDRTLGIRGGGTHNIYGGWNDATGDRGKHLSHLSYANYFNPQQIPFVAWALLNANELQPSVFGTSAKQEAAWGADYLLRSLASQGYFYMSVFDNWGWNTNGPREICAWSNSGGDRSTDYQSAMREGAGVSIAALARAYKAGISGESSSEDYLAGAIRAYAHLKTNPTAYQDNGKENIIDDYCGLLAATELYNATGEQQYFTDAQSRANSLMSRQNSEGWFYTHKDNGTNARPFYHAADEGLPVVALARYVEVFGEPDNLNAVRETVRKNFQWYIDITYGASNPFEYVKMYGSAGSGSNSGDIARGKTATASQTESGYPASNAFDGNTETRWSSFQNGVENNNQWITVDLGGVYNVDKVILRWEAAYGKGYRIEVSQNGSSWTTAATITNNAVIGTKITHTFDPKSARYVRMYGTELGLTSAGYSLYDFEVYGEAEQSSVPVKEARFFMPHDNETGYWWQGENARIASLSAAFTIGAYLADPSGEMWRSKLFGMATAQLDWILGKNPFGVTLMHGFGAENYPNYGAIDPISNIKGGICNGITAKDKEESDIDWFSNKGDAGVNWRWIEQWLPHNAWYLTAISAISYRIDNPTAIRTKQPTNNTMHFSAYLANGGSIEVYNMQGKKLYSQSLPVGSSFADIKKPSHITHGVYLLKVKNMAGTNVATGKIYWR